MKDFQENIVPSAAQNSKPVFIHHNPKCKNKILFVGNSITKHAPKPSIGWELDCGMAASCLENDYVHLMIEKAKQYDENVSFAIAAIAEFERGFFTLNLPDLYQDAADYDADIVIMFFGANVAVEYDTMENPPKTFGAAYEELRNFVSHNGKAKVFHSQGYYIRPVLDDEKMVVAEKYGDEFINIEDIRNSPDTHGMFNHPNDLGMQLIADRFWEYVEKELK